MAILNILASPRGCRRPGAISDPQGTSWNAKPMGSECRSPRLYLGCVTYKYHNFKICIRAVRSIFDPASLNLVLCLFFMARQTSFNHCSYLSGHSQSSSAYLSCSAYPRYLNLNALSKNQARELEVSDEHHHIDVIPRSFRWNGLQGLAKTPASCNATYQVRRIPFLVGPAARPDGLHR